MNHECLDDEKLDVYRISPETSSNRRKKILISARSTYSNRFNVNKNGEIK